MQRTELVRRYLLFIISLFFSALGVAFTKHGELGVSPISSVANVLYCRFPSLSMGTWLILWNCVLILGQILLLRKNFRPVQLLQIPLSFLFGWFTDLGMWMVAGIPAAWYPVRLCMVFAGVVILGFGISLAVTANVIMNSGEAFVKALSDITQKDFGTVKITFDIFCVTFSILLSLLFFQFHIVGAREGTIISAFLTGWSVKCFTHFLKKPLTDVLTGKKAEKC